MSLWLLVRLGVFGGAILRYWISGQIQIEVVTLLVGTLVVNFLVVAIGIK